ncbi:hypothetical protein AQJ30_15420 [Streptomyces longwoodensis]|uniref:Uncharacterized protein n=1 Tax=Streptomyces longwoodensis TaxID=68231 RepID=A0A101QX27_9ACTN|nr:hypothetical protein [Streptomyces longwoodensis]KUN37672.1 hypothetical protein AQJ30_15420 [Streptomyces longwoodensis]
MALSPLAIDDLAQSVLGCVCAALDQVAEEVPGHPGCPDCRRCVVPGTAAWDGCEDPCSGSTGGQLSVNVSRIFPSTVSDFPRQDQAVRDARNCQPPPVTAVELVVTVLRCAPGPTEDGCPPTCDELADAARTLHVDALAVYNALLCCLPKTASGRRGRRFVLGQQRAVGPQGGCVGIEQTVTVALPACNPCPEDTP